MPFADITEITAETSLADESEICAKSLLKSEICAKSLLKSEITREIT